MNPLKKYGRSVLLFNTWTEPPLGLPPPSENECFKGYCGDYDKKKTKCLTAPRQDWMELQVVLSPNVGESSTTLANGSPKRRNHIEDSVQPLSNKSNYMACSLIPNNLDPCGFGNIIMIIIKQKTARTRTFLLWSIEMNSMRVMY